MTDEKVTELRANGASYAQIPVGQVLKIVKRLPFRSIYNKFMRIVGRYLGLMLAQVAMTVDPEMFVIGGGVSKAGHLLASLAIPVALATGSTQPTPPQLQCSVSSSRTCKQIFIRHVFCLQAYVKIIYCRAYRTPVYLFHFFFEFDNILFLHSFCYEH